MKGAVTVKVGDIATQIRGVSYSGADVRAIPGPGYVPILRATNIGDDALDFDDLVFVPNADVKPGQMLRENDVLVAASSGSLASVGKAASMQGNFTGAFGAFCKVLRPSGEVHPRYFAHFFRTSRYRRRISSLAAGANINNIRNKHLDELDIPLPPPDEQLRIAQVLDAAQNLRARERRARARADALEASLLAHMFGSGLASRAWHYEALSSACRCVSGSTPAKAFAENWVGHISWFSAKDLKAPDLWDSQDHVCEAVVGPRGARLLPADTVVMLVRGMTLGHTVPISTLRMPGTINQDLKALLPVADLRPDFLAAYLRSQESRLLGSVSTAAHGTKRLDADALDSISVPLPPLEMQEEFALQLRCVRGFRASQVKCSAHLDALFASLQHRAFAGEL